MADGAIDSGYGWSEIYLNGGNDTLTLSKDINFIVHMGAGDDKVYAQETTVDGAYVNLGYGNDEFFGELDHDFAEGGMVMINFTAPKEMMN